MRAFCEIPGKPWRPTQVFPAALSRPPSKTTFDLSIWPFSSPSRHTPPVVTTYPPRSVLRWGRSSSQPVDQAQYFLEQFLRHRDLGHLEDGVAGVAHDLGPDLHQLLPQAVQRPLRDRLGQVCLFKALKIRESIEFSVPQSYRHRHALVRCRVPSLVSGSQSRFAGTRTRHPATSVDRPAPAMP